MKLWKKRMACVMGVIMTCGTLCSSVAAQETETTETADDTFVMESEYVDFFGLSGPGMSSSATEVEMIISDSTGAWEASEGHYVGYTHAPDITFTYEFTSDKEAMSTLVLRLASDQGDIEGYGNEALGITMNGEDFAFKDTFTLSGKKFEDYVISDEFPIQEGDNVLELTVKQSDVFQASFGSFVTFGPLFDCVKLETDARLSWEPIKENV